MQKAIIITGPTATGKTGMAVKMASQFSGEIISADSRQVYRGLDIGTGKDLDEYGDDVNYHIIDVADADSEYSLYQWRSDFINAASGILNRNKLPLISGGTPLYIDMLLKDYELQGESRQYSESDYSELNLEELAEKLRKTAPGVYEKTDLTQRNRILRALEIGQSEKTAQQSLPDLEYLIIAPYWHRKIVHQRIEKRLNERWDDMIVEVEGLLESGITHEKLEWFGLEYRYMSRLLKGDLTRDQAFEQLLIKIRQFAKRQDIWFRKMERSGTIIHWVPGEEMEPAARGLIKKFLDGEELPEPQIKISEITYGPKSQ